jgi:hypothetical protein
MEWCLIIKHRTTLAYPGILIHELRKTTKNLIVTGLRTEDQNGDLLNMKQTWSQSRCETDTQERHNEICSYILECWNMGRARGAPEAA